MRAFLHTYARDVAGLGGFGLVMAGVWGRCGWPWAAIVAGLPITAFYFLGEIRGGVPG